MITTTEYWDVDGTPLNTMAKNIETLTGRGGIPELLGDNIQVPYKVGRIWRPKEPDSRTLTLAMWVIGCDNDGGYPTGDVAQHKLFNENWDGLKRLFFVRRRQLSVTKRWEMNSGMKVATALAEPAGTMEPSMFHRNGAKFVVDLLLADPFFYGPNVVTNIPLSTPTVVNNDGHDYALKMSIRFNGPLTNPVLTNSTPDLDVILSYNGIIAGGAYVDFDTDLFTAKTNLGASVLANVTHDGALSWMELQPGNNTLTLTASAGSGNASVTFKAPYV